MQGMFTLIICILVGRDPFSIAGKEPTFWERELNVLKIYFVSKNVDYFFLRV